MASKSSHRQALRQAADHFGEERVTSLVAFGGKAPPKGKKELGAARGIRTPDPIITNDVLYQLSYCGMREEAGLRQDGCAPRA
jgi:hypothetical protein